MALERYRGGTNARLCLGIRCMLVIFGVRPHSAVGWLWSRSQVRDGEHVRLWEGNWGWFGVRDSDRCFSRPAMSMPLPPPTMFPRAPRTMLSMSASSSPAPHRHTAKLHSQCVKWRAARVRHAALRALDRAQDQAHARPQRRRHRRRRLLLHAAADVEHP